MRKPEKQLFDLIKDQVGNAWDMQAHEDKYSRGIPDLSFGVGGINGWIELKRREKWPRDPSSPVLLKHFTPHQKNWLRRRQKFGGNTWFLLQVADDYLLFKGDQCDDVGVGLNKKELIDKAFSICSEKSNIGRWLYAQIVK